MTRIIKNFFSWLLYGDESPDEVMDNINRSWDRRHRQVQHQKIENKREVLAMARRRKMADSNNKWG